MENNILSLEEVDSLAYMNFPEWESLWLNNKTDWCPDTLPFTDSALGIARVRELRETKQLYVAHVDSGVHAYKIGFYSEFKELS
jgi:hypothetical protein